jgi:deoxyinosine 3'endonuclease (endonuclease V)
MIGGVDLQYSNNRKTTSGAVLYDDYRTMNDMLYKNRMIECLE